MRKSVSMCSGTALLAGALVIFASGCASAPSTPRGRDFESLPLAPASPDSVFGVSGTKDSNNDFLSTLWVLWPDGRCSGVLIAPRLVLTSAHCFCLPLDFGKATRIYDIADCGKNAPTQVEVATIYYGNTGNPKDDIPITGEGTVMIHEDFKSEIRNGVIQRHQADLAVIRLKAPLAFEWKGVKRIVEPTGNLPDRDVTLDEILTFVGYGPSHYRGKDEGVRRLGTNKVTDIDYSSRPIPEVSNGVVDLSVGRGKREFRFRAQGTHTRAGDSGGPCFRTEGSKQWLVGINGGSANQGHESWFTSTFPYKSWIEKQQRLIETR